MDVLPIRGPGGWVAGTVSLAQRGLRVAWVGSSFSISCVVHLPGTPYYGDTVNQVNMIRGVNVTFTIILESKVRTISLRD